MKISTKYPIRKILFLVIAFFSLIFTLVFNIIQKNIEIDVFIFTFIKDLSVVVAFTTIFFFIKLYWKVESSPLRRIIALLFLGVFALAITIFISQISPAEFELKNFQLIPLSLKSIFIANIVSIVLGICAIVILLLLKDIIYYKRRFYTARNFFLLIIGLIAASLSTIDFGVLENKTLSYILYGLMVLLILLNSFRLSWIVYLSKKEKLLTVIYSLFLFSLFIGLITNLSESASIGKYLLYYSSSLKTFVEGTFLFCIIYFGMTFVGTLFHLPTADAFDRKMSEVSSLHNLSKLVTQVFDFEELVDSVTTMILKVSEARSSWLEIIQTQSNGGVFVAAQKNISMEDIERINSRAGNSLNESETIRDLVIAERKSIVIDNANKDKRTNYINGLDMKLGSMLVVPLISHNNLIGILYATKDIEYGFDREDVEVITGFADQAAIAIDNSRLIEKSLERERLVREMAVAQEMQMKLLPQKIPSIRNVELDALSTPAFEVGGDYYDFMLIDDNKLAIVIGDVAGKGVSAAFYMAELKGVFQSICKIYPSPKKFVAEVNKALSSSIDKRSFISLIYAVVDLETGVVTIARAGHCPFLVATRDGVKYVKPEGIAIGMGDPSCFADYIKEEKIKLSYGDVCVFYTDGITEAMPLDKEEYGYQRLADVVKKHFHLSAVEIRDEIINSVNQHMNYKPPADDITLIILKWLKK